MRTRTRRMRRRGKEGGVMVVGTPTSGARSLQVADCNASNTPMQYAREMQYVAVLRRMAS